MLGKIRDEWKTIPLNVAVIGNSGVGKSSFINAIRGLNADDEGAAAVGVKETTVDIESYSHPSNPLLKFWDLPGVGSNRFPRQTYLSRIDVERCDFFLLITADRFTENDSWLGSELRKRNRKYFFIRTKVGVDISNDKKAHPRTHDEEAVMKKIRESTEEQLKANRCENVPIFLIDSYQPTKFEFHHLEHKLIEEFPELKKEALILSLPATSKETIQLKGATLRTRMWIATGLTGVVAAIPLPAVPGAFLIFDMLVVIEEAISYYKQLGLDEASLKRCASRTSTDYLKLQAIVANGLGFNIPSGEECNEELRQGLAQLVTVLYNHAEDDMLASKVKEVSWFIPQIHPFIAVTASIAGTYTILELVLEKMESVAVEVIQFATKSAIDTE